METQTTEAAEYVLRFINQTNRSVFLTGRAGTGKTTLLREIIRTTYKNTVVVAPTGIAALNAGGVTIHSLFQLPFATFIPEEANVAGFSFRCETPATLRRHFKMSAQKQAVIRNLELLVIDEVSMLRPDVLDAMDLMLRHVRQNSRPYGGVQVLFIGDLLQLPPVIKNEEWRALSAFYSGKYFFHAKAALVSPPVYIELSKIFRQSDDEFIAVLNNLRNNRITASDNEFLSRFVIPGFDSTGNPGYITLTTHNHRADQINTRALEDLSAKEQRYFAQITGEFTDSIFPVDEELVLKEGAQVMFIKNDLSAEKLYYNGKTGIVKSLSEEEILVYFPEEKITIGVDRYEWQNIKYSVSQKTGEIIEEVVGTFVQYPLKLAWAITVHKSQGLTFEKAVIDVSQVFMPGQAYVALSRLRSTDGLVLLSPLRMDGPSSDEDVIRFAGNRAQMEQLDGELHQETKRFVYQRLSEAFDLIAVHQEWKSVAAAIGGKKSEAAKFGQWIRIHISAVEALLQPAQGFRNQLSTLFSDDSMSPKFLMERVNSAHDYFFPKLDSINRSLFSKLRDIASSGKSKAIYKDFMELETRQTAAVIAIMKARIMAMAYASGTDLSRETLISPEIRRYRQHLLDSFGKQDLLGDDGISERKSGDKKVKISTVMQTYEMWRQRRTIAEIASERKLTKQTINTHLAKLVKDDLVDISELIGPDRRKELEEAFEGRPAESVNPIKEKVGTRFTWDELKLYNAFLSRASKPPSQPE